MTHHTISARASTLEEAVVLMLYMVDLRIFSRGSVNEVGSAESGCFSSAALPCDSAHLKLASSICEIKFCMTLFKSIGGKGIGMK